MIRQFVIGAALVVLAVGGTTFHQSLYSQGTTANPLLIATDKPSVNVKIAEVRTPRFEYSIFESKKTNGDRENSIKSLQIEAEFMTSKASNTDYAWVDDLLVKYEVIVPKGNYLGKTKSYLLTGSDEYTMIRRDGKKHYVVGFIHPGMFEAVRPVKGNGVSDGDTKFENAFIVRVSLWDKNQKMLADGFYIPKEFAKVFPNKTINDLLITRKSFEKMIAEGSAIIRRENAVQRRGTPFENLNYSYYELLKTEVYKR